MCGGCAIGEGIGSWFIEWWVGGKGMGGNGREFLHMNEGNKKNK
jgi:hypothetical protein